MSGRKAGYVTPSPRLQLQRVLGPLATQLSNVRNDCSELLSEHSQTGVAELREQLSLLRKQLQQFNQSSSRRDGLDAAYDAEQLLHRFESALGGQPLAKQFEDINALIESTIARGNLSALPTVVASAQQLIERATAAVVIQREVSKVLGEIQKVSPSSSSVGSAGKPAMKERSSELLLAEITTRAIVSAARESIDVEAREAGGITTDDATLGELDRAKHTQALAEARNAAEKADIKTCDNAVRDARLLRLDAARRATAMRIRIAERDTMAAHLSERLKQLNYDAPDIRLVGTEEQGEMAPLVLYAANPSGRANVRVTMPIDGELIIEIDGVAEGEERTCVELLAGFSEAMKAIEQDFKITDFGRAQHAVSLEEQVKVRLATKEKERHN